VGRQANSSERTGKTCCRSGEGSVGAFGACPKAWGEKQVGIQNGNDLGADAASGDPVATGGMAGVPEKGGTYLWAPEPIRNETEAD